MDRQGRGVNDVKKDNRCLVLRTVVDRPMISRGELAKATGLSKMSMSNIIGELTQMGVVCDMDQGRSPAGALGRRPGYLDLADTSPCAIGVSIARRGLQVTLGDLRTRIVKSEARSFPPDMDQARLMGLTLDAIDCVRRGVDRPVLGVGVAAIGPVSTQRGTILSPANFFGLHDVPIVDAVAQHTGLPVYLAPDSMAGALAEKLFGQGRAHSNFLFVLVLEGIGCGIIVNDKPYAGERGLGGELGHASICFDGPACTCGSHGCLELYANTGRMARHIEALAARGQRSALSGRSMDGLAIWRAAYDGDGPALSAAREYCDYVACALANMVNVFDPELIYLCLEKSEQLAEFIASLLRERVQRRILAPDCRFIQVHGATFGAQAVVKGSLALAISHVFDGTLPLSGEG